MISGMGTEEIIRALGLRPLPVEGGLFAENVQDEHASSIYYLLLAHQFSALHRLPTDEIFHFYLGDPVLMLQLSPGGEGKFFTLGQEVLRGQSPQVVVPAGTWQGSYLVPGGTFALLGTTMAPAFDFADYETADRATLLAEFPGFADEIRRLTR